MANSVDLVIGGEAIKQVENLISKLSIADAELLKISQSALGASKGISGISTPSGLDKTVSSTTALNAQLEKQNTIINKLHADLAKKAEQSRLAEIKLQQQREKAFDSFEKNAQKEAVLTEKNNNAYNRTQTQITNLTKAYNDLAVRKARYNDLSAHEEMRLGTLAKVNDKYNGLLRGTDAIIGKNTRNVGNYANGYNALGNSINQLTREAPAFANSVNTGFMALSNNFPALFDAINGIRAQNKLLVAEGKPTISTLGSIAKSVFSWQTALSVGVTLLTLYGGKIVSWIGSLMDGGKVVSSLAEKQEQLNDALNEGSSRYTEEKVNIDVLYKTATDLNNSYKDRKRAVDDLQEQYPFYFKNLSDEAIMAGDAKKQYDLLSEAILTTARARAAEGILQEKEKERLEIEQEQIGQINNLYTSLSKVKKANASTRDPFMGNAENYIKNIQAVRNAMKEQRKQWEADDAFFVQTISKGNAIEDTLLPDPKAKKAKQKKEKRDDLEFLESYIKPVGNIVEEINSQIENLQVIKITGTPAEREEAKKDIETLIDLKKQLMGGSPTGGALPDFVVPDNAPAQAKLKNDWKDTFNDIAESAQKAGDIIAGFSEMNFQNEYARLEAQKDISLKFAGESAEAKAKIEQDYENKRKEIANRENKAKQKQALFNIAIDTAQAVVEALPNVPLAIAMGIFGAAQAVLVASQKIPQYFDGTDNHGGGLMLVNDGSGANYREKIVLPGGKEIIPEGRNVLMNAPKGTKVLTHEQQIMEMLNERGVSMSKSYQSNGGMTANEMDSVLGKHFAKIQTNHTSFDRNGFRSWSESNGNRTIQNNNRVSRAGFNV